MEKNFINVEKENTQHENVTSFMRVVYHLGGKDEDVK